MTDGFYLVLALVVVHYLSGAPPASSATSVSAFTLKSAERLFTQSPARDHGHVLRLLRT
jgi:hypothetical protein